MGLDIVLITLTILVFYFAGILQSKINIPIFNPVLITIIISICIISVLDITYNEYKDNVKYIEYLLKPAIVSLGVPLYLSIKSIKRQLIPIIISQITGCIIGIGSVIVLASIFELNREIIISLSPKSVTTPIAIEISEIIGGNASITAAVVVCVGIFGAVFGKYILNICKIKSDYAMGLAIGTATHAVGTSAAIQWSRRCGAYSGLGLIINGILTAILTPFIIKWFGL